jgi:hypothetical protein
MEDVALERVKKRAKEEDRAIDSETIKKCSKRFRSMFEDYVNFLPEVVLYCHGQVCLKKENGEIKKIDSKAYKEFLNVDS